MIEGRNEHDNPRTIVTDKRVSEAKIWKLDNNTYQKLINRFDTLNNQTQDLTRSILVRTGGRGAAMFLSAHEKINNLLTKSVQVDPEGHSLVGLVSIIYKTISAFNEGLSGNGDKDTADRLADFAMLSEDELPDAVNKTIEKITGKATQKSLPKREDFSID